MKLHLPVLLRKALLACFSVCFAYSMGSLVSAANLTLGNEDSLTIDHADIASIPDLENGTLQLNGDTLLLLSNCGVGDGKAYTLLTGVSALLDAKGNAIVLDSSNNAISHYFDTTRPGVGFWADATLALTDDGTLQLVRHHETVKAAQTITTRQTESLVYSYYAGISFEDITQSSSSSSVYGGAIYGYSNSTIRLSGNGSVMFSGNTASASSSSTAYARGGAIYGSAIELSGNGSVTFSGNRASSSYYNAYGGAIFGHDYSTIELSGNGSVTFSGNTASSYYSAYGGAIYGAAYSTITLSGNGSVTFSGNTANYGGAIYGRDNSTITLNNNGSVTFSGNTASSLGGAIFGGSNSTIELSGNGSVTFSGNTASYFGGYPSGGAIYGHGGDITLSGNGSVTFSGNGAYSGGAIYGYGTIDLSGNESVTFSGNTASDEGGAIRVYGNLSILNNDSVLFEKNAEESGSSYRLRSICAVGSVAVISLSASAGKSIEFRDSVYIAFGSTVNLNADYTDAEGVIHKQTGDIIFTGAYTEQHLNELLAADGLNRTATEAEILNSRTTEVRDMTNLYGGRLRVEDKAVLKLNGGLTVVEGGNATVEVKAAELNLGSHALSMVSGSSLALADGAKVTATEVTITTGATLAVRGSVTTTPLTEQVTALTLSEETVAGFDAARAVNTGSVSVLEGDLTLESGSLLSLDDGYLELSGNLFFDVAEGEEKIALDIAPGIITEANNQVVLFNVDGVVTFGFDGLTASADNGMVYCVKAEDYFTGNRVTESMKLVYDSSTGMVYLENAAGAVPEPTTTTLSLLALAALAARRRRK